MDAQQAKDLAASWIDGWNSHDLDRIMEHYDDAVVVTSPVAARLLNEPSGTVNGKAALRAYFAKGLAFYPSLKFELIDTLAGLRSLVLYYRNQNGTKTAEYMEIGEEGRILRVVANYAIL
jgi:hypothetical protein